MIFGDCSIHRMVGWVTAFLLLSACGSHRYGVSEPRLGNFGVRYNVLFNALNITNRVELGKKESSIDDCSVLLDPFSGGNARLLPADMLLLDSAEQKAKRIIREGGRSDYVPQAYFLLARICFIKGNFYQSAEYYRYVFNVYKGRSTVAARAKLHEAVSLYYLGDKEQAWQCVDSVKKYAANQKDVLAELHAFEAKYEGDRHEYGKASASMRYALGYNPGLPSRRRWEFMLAQLYEKRSLPDSALLFYKRLQRPGTSMDLYMQSLLATINLKAAAADRCGQQRSALLRLLKKDIFSDYTDLIYLRMGVLETKCGSMSMAEEYFRKATASVSRYAMPVKAEAFRRLADMSFSKGRYEEAGRQLDSALGCLPQAAAQRMVLENTRAHLLELESLHERVLGLLQKQAFARLPSIERRAHADSVRRDASFGNRAALNPNFYFNNGAARKQGVLAFKKRWGQRALQDDWRTNSSEIGLPGNPGDVVKAAVSKDDSSLASATPALSPGSIFPGQELVHAYLSLSEFYVVTIRSNADAIRVLEEARVKIADTTCLAPIYHRLYMLHSASNTAVAEQYAKWLRVHYPGSEYTRALSQQAMQAQDRLVLNERYLKAYNALKHAGYSECFAVIGQTLGQYPQNELSAQLSYLHLLATGYTASLPLFERELDSLAAIYPTHQLLGPLFSEYQRYVRGHRNELMRRKTALLADDEGRQLFVVPREEETVTWHREDLPFSLPLRPATSAAVRTPALNLPLAGVNKYTWPDTASYYFVINVNSVRADIGPSMFSLRQFLRSYDSSRHLQVSQYAVNDENTLLVTGVFGRYEAVKRYERTIIPIIREIMKLAFERYNTFVVTKDELDKLKSRRLIDEYLRFYSNNK